jgi:hypothetical protein
MFPLVDWNATFSALHFSPDVAKGSTSFTLSSERVFRYKLMFEYLPWTSRVK